MSRLKFFNQVRHVHVLPSQAPPFSSVPSPGELAQLKSFVFQKNNLVVLTGAGVSTESGVPDYRSPHRRPASPIQHQDFLRSHAIRQRYWARSFIGYPTMLHAKPNIVHHALVELERQGTVSGVITQNVDSLHKRAGQDALLELHGTLREVQCLSCHSIVRRASLQEEMKTLNLAWVGLLDELRHDSSGEIRPDGDVALENTQDFVVPACARCEGVLKPKVTFFGDSVPRPTVDASIELVNRADALLVLGSTLQVWSGYRFAKQAASRNIPIAIVNYGATRADHLATVKVTGSVNMAMEYMFADAPDPLPSRDHVEVVQ